MKQITGLAPYARNARTHSEEQIAQIAASIAEFGFTNPILIGGDDVIIAGHSRLRAAQMLELPEVPVIVLDHLSDAQRRALIIADNRIAQNAGWDEDLLRAELATLQDMDFDLELIGFDDEELDRLLSDLEAPGIGDAVDGEDDVPEPPVDPISRPGDLWIMGAHRLLSGDSTVATDVVRLSGAVSPMLMVTDPPDGVEYDPAWRNQTGASATKRTGKVLNDDRADWREAWALFPGDVAYVWHGALHAAVVAESLEISGFAIRSQTIRAKERLVLSRAIITGSMNPAGMRCARRARAIGLATESKPHSGISPAGIRTPKLCMALKSQSNACAVRS